MKRAMINSIRKLHVTGRILIALVMLCGICPLLNIPNSNTFSQPAVIAASNLQSSSKSPKEIEYEVKAAFIYNFMKFVEWPSEKNKPQDKEINPENRMIIGIIGNNPFGDAFTPILNKEVHSRKIHLVEIPSYHEFVETYADKTEAFTAYQLRFQKTIRSCDVVFFCESEKHYVNELIRLVSGSYILTISDLSGFAKKDGIIGFVKDDNKIRFEINLTAAQKENIKIRSQLLTLAKEVYGSK